MTTRLRVLVRHASRRLNRLTPSQRRRVSRLLDGLARLLSRAIASARPLGGSFALVARFMRFLEKLQVKLAERAETLAATLMPRSGLAPMAVIERASNDEKIFAEANARFREGSTRAAYDLLEHHLERLIEDPVVLWSVIRLLLNHGRPEKATDLIGRAEALAPARRDIMAIKTYTQAVFADVSRLLCRACELDGGPDRAAAYALARQKAAASPPAAPVLARTRVDPCDLIASRTRIPDARTPEELSVAVREALPWTLYRLALRAGAEERFHEALAFLDDCLAHHPSFVDAHRARGQFLLHLGRGSEAAIAFEEHLQAAHLSPDSELVAVLELAGNQD